MCPMKINERRPMLVSRELVTGQIVGALPFYVGYTPLSTSSGHCDIIQ